MKLLVKCLLVATAVLCWNAWAFAAPATRVAGAIWANNNLYDTVLTDTSFHLPPTQSTDVLFNFMMSGLSGQRSVSVAGPGDSDFNGGRWAIKIVVFTDTGKIALDPDNDGVVNYELTDANAVYQYQSLGYLEILDTSIYFECPLLPRKH